MRVENGKSLEVAGGGLVMDKLLLKQGVEVGSLIPCWTRESFSHIRPSAATEESRVERLSPKGVPSTRMSLFHGAQVAVKTSS